MKPMPGMGVGTFDPRTLANPGLHNPELRVAPTTVAPATVRANCRRDIGCCQSDTCPGCRCTCQCVPALRADAHIGMPCMFIMSSFPRTLSLLGPCTPTAPLPAPCLGACLGKPC